MGYITAKLEDSMYTVAAFYRFFPLADPSGLREELCEMFSATDLLGTTLIAPEAMTNSTATNTASRPKVGTHAKTSAMTRSPPGRRNKASCSRNVSMTLRHRGTSI